MQDTGRWHSSILASLSLALSLAGITASARAMPVPPQAEGRAFECGTGGLCQALRTRTCSLATGDDYWTCSAITQRMCSLIEDADGHWMCRGVLDQQCSVVTGSRDQELCRMVVRNDCDEAGDEDYELCVSLTRALFSG